MAGTRDAKALIRADNRRLRGDLAKSKSMFKRTFRGISRSVKSSLKSALSPLGVGAAATGLAIFGRQALDFEKGLTRLAIQAGATDQEVAGMRDQMLSLSKATGLGREQILAGATALTNLLGHTATSAERLEVLTRASQATGATMSDLATIAFKLDTAFDVRNGEDLEMALDALTFAGKSTSITLAEMGPLLARTAPLFKQTGASGIDAAADLGAFLQITQKFGTAKGPEEVATQFASFINSLEQNASKLKKFNVDVFRPVGADGVLRLRGARDVLGQIANSELARNPELLKEALGRVESKDFTKSLVDNMGAYDDLAAASRKAGGTIKADFQKFMESPAGRTEKAFSRAKERILEAFTPERIEKFAEVLEDLVGVLEFMVDNAKAFVAVWVGFKAATIASQIGAMATAATGLSATTTGLVGSTAKVGANIGTWAGGIAAAGVAGFAFGTALDKWLGVSDWIGDMAIDERDLQNIDTGLIQDQIKQIQGIHGGVATRRQAHSASSFLQAAQRSGAIGPGGKIAEGEKLQKFALGGRTASAGDASSFRQVQAAREALETAMQVASPQQLADLRGEVKINVQVDHDRRTVNVQTPENINIRRGTQ